MMEQIYISRQIAVYKTDKKLVEILDKLNPAPLESYAHTHAQGETFDDKKRYSIIGIVMQDYSNGTGDNTVKVCANISPDEAQFIYSRVKIGIPTFEFKQDKIFGTPDEKGNSKVTKIRIARASVGADGKPRNYPWYMEIENGIGIAAKGKTGGTYCQKNSYSCQHKVFTNLTDLDFFKLFNRTSQFITSFEGLVGPSLIKQGKEMIESNIKANIQANI